VIDRQIHDHRFDEHLAACAVEPIDDAAQGAVVA
jgi:hypothetical protein